MSQWVRGRKTGAVAAAVFSILAKCRAKARGLSMARSHAVAGNVAKSQVWAKRAERGVSGKARLEEAKRLRAQRAAARAAPTLREQAAAHRAAKGTREERKAAVVRRIDEVIGQRATKYYKSETAAEKTAAAFRKVEDTKSQARWSKAYRAKESAVEESGRLGNRLVKAQNVRKRLTGFHDKNIEALFREDQARRAAKPSVQPHMKSTTSHILEMARRNKALSQRRRHEMAVNARAIRLVKQGKAEVPAEATASRAAIVEGYKKAITAVERKAAMKALDVHHYKTAQAILKEHGISTKMVLKRRKKAS